MKRIAILGSTGSIGTNALGVLENLRDDWQVVGLAAGRNVELLSRQAWATGASWVYAVDSAALARQKLPKGCQIISGQDELCQACAANDIDMVLCAIVGTSGFAPVLAAIRAGKGLALASKEILVMAGELVTRELRKHQVRILPVDSEHCAIFQCLDGHPRSEVKQLLLTASGGPFRNRPELDFSQVTVEQTLCHPTWSMGRKITIDCASLMNKGLELLEAGWLFDVKEEQITVVVHPQSIVHSMVEFVDGSIIAQLGVPNMALPIHYCLNYPHRVPSLTPPVDFTKMQNLTFEAPDVSRFPALNLARGAMRAGKTAGAVFNAANEVAVEKFIAHQLSFAQIPQVVERTLEMCPLLPADNLENILATDAEARRIARQLQLS